MSVRRDPGRPYRRTAMSEPDEVIDPGPFPYAHLPCCGDPDLEHGLRHAGFEPADTSYRLIAIPLAALVETTSMSKWQHMTAGYADALRAGADFPPLVVMRSPQGWALLDGVNRSYAYWVVGQSHVTAYELLPT